MSYVVISVDHELLEPIDRAARANGLSRSKYLSDVIARQFGVEELRHAREAGVDDALRELDQLFVGFGLREDATGAVRAERDAR